MPSPEAALRGAIEQCYLAFSAMPQPRKLDASPVHDDDEELLESLIAVPLRALTGEQIEPYSHWAINTVGDDRDYRYFLPRILELSTFDPWWAGSEPALIAKRIGRAGWRHWPAGQQQAVLASFRAAFHLAAVAHPSSRRSAADWLCALIRLGQPPSLCVERWRSIGAPYAALQLASFIDEVAKTLRRHGEVRGPFWEEVDREHRRELATLLLSDATRAFLQAAATRVSEDDRFQFLDAALLEFG